MKYLQQYKEQIANGEAVIGSWMQKNLEYVEAGMNEGRFFYDEKKAELKIQFIENFMHHIEGRSDLIKLEVWQKYMIACIFGLVDENGKRQFREVPVVMARKQGKSLMAGACENAVFFTESEPGMQIYNLAPKLEQANIIYNVVKAQIDSEKCLRDRVRVRRTDVWQKKKNATLKPLAFNSKKSDGFNPYWVTYDEFAAWEGEASLKMYNVMQSGGGARITNPPIHFACSTANYVDDGLYDLLISRGQAVLNGTSNETKLLPFIYMIDDEKKWDDINELRKAMPNLGVSVTEEFIEEEIVKAKESRPYYFEFMTKYCNVKQNSVSAWITQSEIKRTMCERLKPEDFRGTFGVGGVDLSQTTDLTSASIVIQRDGIDYVLNQMFMSRDAFTRLTDEEHINYPLHHDLGNLTISGEHFVDYHDVTAWFEKMKDEYEIYTCVVGYDRYSAQYFVDEMKSRGYLMDDVIQGTNLTPIIDEFGGLVRDGKVKTGTNGLLQSHFKNVVLEQNFNDKRVRPKKLERTKHIDGFVATIDAYTVRQKHWDKFQWRLLNPTIEDDDEE